MKVSNVVFDSLSKFIYNYIYNECQYIERMIVDAFDRSYKMYQRKEKKRSRSKKITDYHPLYKEIGDCMHAQRRPNYFVAVQIKNEKVRLEVNEYW